MKVMVSLVEAKAEAMEMEAVMVAWVKQPRGMGTSDR